MNALAELEPLSRMKLVQNNDLWQQNVEFMPYIQAFPALAEHHQYDEKLVALSEDHTQLFGIHSSKSFLIPHMEALSIINESVIQMFGEAPTIEVTSVKHGASIRAKIALDSFPNVDLGNNDTSRIHLLFSNNYARASDFKLGLGVYRQVCSNGMVVGQTVAGFNARHLVDEGFNATSLQSKVARIIEESKHLYDIWMAWKDIFLSYEEALALFEKRFSASKLEQILSPAQFPCDLWTIYNAFTAHSTHESKVASSQIAMDNSIASLFYGRTSPLREVDGTLFETLKTKKEEAIEAEFEEV